MNIEDRQVTPIEQAQENRDSTMADLSFRMFNPKLAALRAQNPFLPILPFPNTSITMLLGAGGTQNIDLPQGTKFIFVSQSDECYFSRQGVAAIPIAPVSGVAKNDTGAFQIPNNVFFYVEEIRQLSVIAVNADTRIAIACYMQM